MKSEIVDEEIEKAEYPFIGKAHDGETVLFHDKGKGVVLVKGTYQVGHYSGDWTMTAFERINGSITIKFDL